MFYMSTIQMGARPAAGIKTGIKKLSRNRELPGLPGLAPGTDEGRLKKERRNKMKIKAFKRRFRDDVVLIDESRKIENPDIGYVVDCAWPAVSVSMAGIWEGVIPDDSDFWGEAYRCRDNFEISIAIDNFGGEEELSDTFEWLAKKYQK